MKKVLSFFGAALFVAAMTVSCGNNKTEAVEENLEETVESVAEEASCAASAATSDADHQAMLDKAREAGEAICNCANGDAASIENCMKSVIASGYAAYQDNDEFTAAVKDAIGQCAMDKAKAAAAKKGEEALSNAANALAGKLGK